MLKKKKDYNLTGATGEYFVCAELGSRGYLALLTPKNNPLFDIIATNSTGQKFVSVQVKTRSASNKYGWQLGSSFSEKKELNKTIIVLVALKDNGVPDFLIYEYEELWERLNSIHGAYMSKKKKDGTGKKETSMRCFDRKDFEKDYENHLNNWDKITKLLDG